MPEPKRHHTSSKVGRRRSHHAMKKVNVQACKVCKAPVISHHACKNCGQYKTPKE